MKGWFISETITRKSTGDITLHQYEVNNMKIYTLSSLIDNHQLFCKFAQDAYSATDCLCQDYPKYFEWYSEGITLEEVENIYNKYNMEFEDIKWLDEEKGENRSRVLKK